MSVVYGFGGFRVKDDRVHLHPNLPENWKSLSFRVIFRKNYLKIYINDTLVSIDNEHGPALQLVVNGEVKELPEEGLLEEELRKEVGA